MFTLPDGPQCSAPAVGGITRKRAQGRNGEAVTCRVLEVPVQRADAQAGLVDLLGHTVA